MVDHIYNPRTGVEGENFMKLKVTLSYLMKSKPKPAWATERPSFETHTHTPLKLNNTSLILTWKEEAAGVLT